MTERRGKDHAALFPSTRWTAVFAARSDPSLRRGALEGLLRPRWRPLYIVARKHGLDPASAEDAVQSFLAKLLEAETGSDLIARLDPERGTLRAYLKTAFRNHLQNLGEFARAEKRGGGRAHEDVGELETLLASQDESPDALFEKAWAVVVFEESLSALEAEFRDGARRGPFEVLQELFAFGIVLPYPELAAKHGMTVAQLKSFVHRAKLRFRELVRERVAATLGIEDDLDGEVVHLLEAMSA
jgi:DNA-directed RNA polymerase specialized sigma24 family protein